MPVSNTKLGPRKTLGLSNNAWNPAIFPVLFGESEANRGIHTDDPTGCQLIWFASASASTTATIFTPDALPAATHPIYHGLGQALSYAGLHIQWLGFKPMHKLWYLVYMHSNHNTTHHNHFMALFRDHPDETVPEIFCGLYGARED